MALEEACLPHHPLLALLLLLLAWLLHGRRPQVQLG
jgi:hypothetical protein